MTRLRKMMLEELQRRNFSEDTIRHYIHTVEDFARHFNRPPDRLGLRHIREYQAHLFQKRKLSLGSVTNHLAALRFFYMPSTEQLDLRALLLHRHHWPRLRTQIQNALQAIALANGLRRGPGLRSHDGQAKIAFLPLPPHASYRRSALQTLYRKMAEEIENLISGSIAANWRRRAWARRAWRWRASWASDCGSCLAIRSITKSSVVVDRSKAVPSVQGCLKRGLVRIVTVRLIRLPASLLRRFA
jgi:Phage integrase, N-terminal SAM-like domain